MALDAMWEEEARRRFGGVWTVPGPGVLRPYRSPAALGRLTRVALAVVVVAAVAVAAQAMSVIVGGASAAASPRLGTDPAAAVERLPWVLLGAVVVATAMFIGWFVRCYRNLPVLGVTGMRFAPAWSLLGWLVPLVNLVVPKELVDDLWRASDPKLPVRSAGWRLRTVPLRIHLWWACLVCSTVLLGIAAWMLAAGTVSERQGALVVVLAHAGVAVAALLSWGLVGEVTQRQQERAAVLGPAPPAHRLRPDSTGLAPVYVLRRTPVSGPTLLHPRGSRVVGRY